MRNYTISERAIIIVGIKAKKSLDEINRVLAQSQEKEKRSPRPLNASSYDMMKKSYVPKLTEVTVWDYIQNPKTISQMTTESKTK